MRKIDRSGFLQCYELGMNDVEIAERFGCSSTTILNWRIENDLKHNRRVANNEILYSLYEQGLLDYEISVITGFNKNTIGEWRRRENLKNNRCNHNKTVSDYRKKNIFRSAISSNAKIVTRDLEQKCIKCGYDKYLIVHHIKPVFEFDDDSTIGEINHIENLAILCPNCHAEVHGGDWSF
jgi:5-methylcytosine-specific restriction endonuclease McrA